MIARLHFSTSLILSYLIYFFIINLNKLDSIILSIITAKLSTIPDFDYKIFSWANKKIMFLKKSNLYIFLFPYYFFLKFLTYIFKHRGITHSIYPVLIFIILKFLISNFFLIFALAFLFHMIEDSLTVSGIQPFYPVYNIKVGIPILNNKDRNLQKGLSILLLIIYFVIIIK